MGKKVSPVKKRSIPPTLLVSLFLCLGCTPKYKPSWEYHPLSSMAGERCAEHCKDSRIDCETLETVAASLEIAAAVTGGFYGDLIPETSESDPDACMEEFAECYVGCGGEVTLRCSCVKNCFGAEPVSTKRIRERHRSPAPTFEGDREINSRRFGCS